MLTIDAGREPEAVAADSAAAVRAHLVRVEAGQGAGG
jgi:hypothetical protein